MAIRQPTPRQIAFCNRYGLAVPKSRKICSRLIGYVKDGNGTIGATADERAEIARRLQKKWENKRISAKRQGLGSVEYISFRLPDEVQAFRMDAEELSLGECIGPIQLMVRWDATKKLTAISPRSVTFAD